MKRKVLMQVVSLFESEPNELFSIFATDRGDLHEPVKVANICIHCLSMSFVKNQLANNDRQIFQQRKSRESNCVYLSY